MDIKFDGCMKRTSGQDMRRSTTPTESEQIMEGCKQSETN